MISDINKKEQYADVDLISRIPIIPTVLEIVCRTTGMGFSAVARVTDEKWIACGVHDEINFGLKPGGELVLETTICHEIRQSQKLVVIDHVDKDEMYCQHHTPAQYGFQSYISVPIIKRNGTFFGTLCAIDPKPAKLKNPAVIGMFNLFAELISFHMSAIEDLESSEEKLSVEVKNAELREQFIAILGHDLRNPLGSISLGAEMLGEMPLNEKALEIVKTIKSSSFRMNLLVNNMLDFARGRLGGGFPLEAKMQDGVDVAIYQVIAEVKTLWPNRILETTIQIAKPVYCDINRIAQLFSNLLGNAFVHGAPDKPIKIHAEAGDDFILAVTNYAPHIDANTLKDLFKPFYRVDDSTQKKGLGLGLYIAKEIAKAHGGDLMVENNNETISFKFIMPCQQVSIIEV